MDLNKTWKSFLDIIINEVSDFSYNSWFRDLELVDINNDTITIRIPYGENHRNHLVKNYYELVQEVFTNITGKTYNIKFLLNIEYKDDEEIKDDSNDIQSFKRRKEIANDEETSIESYKYYSNFNKKYTFDTFVVGDSNRIAYSTALAVANSPGKIYNPFFIHGKSGLGKTHLMHAIGNHIIQNSEKKVLYITTEQFINDFISISKKSDKNENNITYKEMFRKKYRNVDVLMIDDIQFLEGAIQSQKEFTNTFNNLYDNEKQIIISSDTSINDLKLLEDRLKTRFGWGLTSCINPPGYELKVKIIENKIKNHELIIELNNEIIDFIANNCGNDVRNLEGSILRLCAYQATWNLPNLTLEHAIDALQEYTNNNIYTPNTINKIMSVVAKHFELDVAALKGKKRNKMVAFARQIAMYLCRIMTDNNYQRIGLEFGGRDHSTVIHSYEKISKELKNIEKTANLINDLKKKISEM